MHTHIFYVKANQILRGGQEPVSYRGAMKARSEPLLEEGPRRFLIAPQAGVVQHLYRTQRELNNPIEQYDVLPRIAQKYEWPTGCHSHGIVFAAKLPLASFYIRDTELPSYLGFIGQPATAYGNTSSDSAEKLYAAFHHDLVSLC